MNNLLRYTGKDLQPITLKQWLSKKNPSLHDIVIKWVEEIKNCGSDVQQIFHDGCPMGCVQDAPFAYVNAFTNHVNVGFFYGNDLPDPNGLLVGDGKRMRHVKIKSDLAVDDSALRKLIHLAYQDIKNRLIPST